MLALLEDQPQRQFLEALDEDDLPENSDVVLMLGQALTAMIAFRGRYYDALAGWQLDPDQEAKD